MSSRNTLNIYAKMSLQSGGAMQDANALNNTLGLINSSLVKDMPNNTAALSSGLKSSLGLVTNIQLARYALSDLQQLASGKGGLGDVLSLATTSIILISKLNNLLQLQIVLKQASLILSAASGNVGAMAGLVIGLGASAVAISASATPRPGPINKDVSAAWGTIERKNNSNLVSVYRSVSG